MHRTFFVARLLGWWGLLVAIGLHTGAYNAAAQNPFPPGNFATGLHHGMIELPVGGSRPCQMTTRADLKRVENPNSNVVRVEKIADRNNEVLLVAEGPGRTLITFVDQKDRVETHEVVVAAAALAQPPGAVEAEQLTIPLGSRDATGKFSPGFRTVRLQEIPIGGITNEDSKVVKVIQSKDDLRMVTFEAMEIGRSRVVFFLDANKQRVQIIDINVVGPEATGVHQVELQVVVAVVNRSMARTMSFSWLTANNNWFVSSLIGGPGALASGLVFPPTAMTLSSTGGNLPFGVLNSNGGHIGFLNALRTEGLTKILAEPRLACLSGEKSRFVSGGKVDIVSAGGVSSAQVSAEFGTILEFQPIVQANNKIKLRVMTEVSTPTNTIPIPGAGGAGTVTFSVLKRSATTLVELEDSQTLAIGGLIQNRVDSSANKIPVLGDMPFFGTLFRNVTLTETEEEMIILVTPRLVDGVDCTRIPRYLPGRETRVPDDYELFLEGILEAPRRPRNVIFHPHYYKGAHIGAANIDRFPCADGTCGRDSCSRCGHGNGGQTVTSHRVASPAPLPSFPNVPATRTSNSRVIVEPDAAPGTFPAMPASLGGPSMPTSTPGISIPVPRQQDTRPVLPPLSR